MSLIYVHYLQEKKQEKEEEKIKSGNWLHKPVWPGQPLELDESLQMKTPNKVFTSRTQYEKCKKSKLSHFKICVSASELEMQRS